MLTLSYGYVYKAATMENQANTEQVGCFRVAAIPAVLVYVCIAGIGLIRGPSLLLLALGPALWFFGVFVAPGPTYQATSPVTGFIFFVAVLVIPDFGTGVRVLAFLFFLSSFVFGWLTGIAATVFAVSADNGEAAAIHPAFPLVLYTCALIWMISPILALKHGAESKR